jgi:hypothetical protein
LPAGYRRDRSGFPGYGERLRAVVSEDRIVLGDAAAKRAGRNRTYTSHGPVNPAVSA